MVGVVRPLFDVGEEVIVVPKMNPDLAGNHVIAEVVDRIAHFKTSCRFCNGTIVYRMIDRSGWAICQCCLRKKPEPGGDFESFMDELKKPIKQPVMVER